VSFPPPGPRLDTSAPDTRRESIERRILEGAQALIDAGVRWHQLGIRQITERADISRTAFYDFFGSKNEVLEHLIRGLHEDLTFNLREVLDPSGAGGFDLTHLRPGLAAAAAFAQRHGNAYRAFLDATAEDEHLAALWEELLASYTALIAASIAAERERMPAAPRDLTPEELARTLLLATERCLIAQPLSEEAAIAAVRSIVFVWERAVFDRPPS
jgi:AcrR family transcriptional regulator